jgi:hypothetical protein
MSKLDAALGYEAAMNATATTSKDGKEAKEGSDADNKSMFLTQVTTIVHDSTATIAGVGC